MKRVDLIAFETFIAATYRREAPSRRLQNPALAAQLVTWAEALPQPAAKMFAMLQVDALSAEELARRLGMQPRGGHWNNGIATLRRNGLIEERSGRLCLTEIAR